jgi:hypothetical protein
MNKTKEVELKLLEISDDPELFEDKFDELVELLKTNPSEKIKLVLKDKELTDEINKAISSKKYDNLSKYLSSIIESLTKNFSDLPPIQMNFSECSLGSTCERIPEELSQTKDNECETVLLDTMNRKITVKNFNQKNVGFIVDKVDCGFSVKRHSIEGSDICNFSNWKLVSSSLMTKESLDKLLK